MINKPPTQCYSPDRYGLRTARGYEGGFTGEYVMALLVDTRHDTTRATTPKARENMAQTDKIESAQPGCKQKAQVCRSG